MERFAEIEPYGHGMLDVVDGNLVAAYARLVEDPDPIVRERALAGWLAWEDAVISLEARGSPGAYSNRPPAARRALVRI